MTTGSKRLIILIIFFALIGIGNYYFKIDWEGMRFYLEGVSVWRAAIIYTLIYVLVSIFLILAKDILKIIGAICLGAVLSSLCIWMAEVINTVVLFSLARYLGRGFVQARLKGNARRIDQRIGSSGFKGFLILRLVPLIPYRVLDLLAGLSSFSFFQYFVIAVIGSPLRIFWVQYILAGVGVAIFNNPAVLVEYIMNHKIILAWSLVYLILVIVVGFRLRFKQRI
ncbi:MAG: VTT domain-containing protein [Candidatus Omnitrophota bacterium]|jgi:uncharacterized membrane protein YdjX (TVP38/TMEM64 family)